MPSCVQEQRASSLQQAVQAAQAAQQCERDKTQQLEAERASLRQKHAAAEQHLQELAQLQHEQQHGQSGEGGECVRVAQGQASALVMARCMQQRDDALAAATEAEQRERAAQVCTACFTFSFR